MRNNKNIKSQPSVASIRAQNIKQDIDMLDVQAKKIMKERAFLIMKLMETRELLAKDE